MRLLTKAEACRELRMSLSTLNRRIAAGELAVQREPHGRRHRVYVMLDEDAPENEHIAQAAELAVARQRMHELEGQVALLQEQLDQERRRNAELISESKTAQDRRGAWWRFWRGGSDC